MTKENKELLIKSLIIEKLKLHQELLFEIAKLDSIRDDIESLDRRIKDLEN